MTATKRKSKKTEAADLPAPVEIESFKGFDHNLQCRGFQFEVGKTYTVGGAIKACENGFHACENPWDVLSYYPLLDDDARFNRFGLVSQGGDIGRHSEDSKIASASITIQAEFTIPQFIGRLVDWVINATTPEKVDAKNGYGAQIGCSGYGAQIGSSGNSAQIGSSGDSTQIGSSGNSARIGSSGNYARIGSSGHYAQIGSSGDGAQIGCSGYGAQIGSSGNRARIGSSGNDAQIGCSGDSTRIGSSGNGAQIGSSGYGAQIGSSGDSTRIGSSGYGARIGSSGYGAQIGSSGDSARIGSSGNYARIGSSGDSAQINVTGENAVIASAGNGARFKGAPGAWVSLAEYDNAGKCVGFATGQIGTDGVPADTWLIARGGKLVEAE